MKQGLEFVNTGAVLICTNGVVPAFFRSNPEPHVFLAALDHGSADDKIQEKLARVYLMNGI